MVVRVTGRSPAPSVPPDLVDGIAVSYRVRFDEATPAGTVRASALLRYAQDVAWIHSERLGFDRAWYEERGLTWLVRSALLVIEGAAPTGEAVTVETRIVGYRRVWARRRTTFVDRHRRAIGWAFTDWVIVDRRGQPTRVPDALPALFASPPPSFEPVRVTLSRTPDEAATIATPVRRSDLDPLGHVNNAAYLDYLEDAVAGLPGGPGWLEALPRAYRIEYAQAADPGDRLRAVAWPMTDPGRPEVAGAGYRLLNVDGVELARATLRLEAPTR